jgi:excisionase family DNA binding protein
MSTNIKIQRICQHCGNEFTAKTTATKYCSHICNSRHYKLKVKSNKIERSNTETLKIKSSINEDVQTKEFLTVRDVATLLSCSIRTAYRLVNNGTIIGVNLAERMTRISKNELQKVLEQPKPLPTITLPSEFSISEYYTINEIQEKFGISQTGLQLLIKKHKIPKTKRGKFVYVPKGLINPLLT